MSRRTEKVASLIQQEVGRFITELELPCMVTISHVNVTDNLASAKIFVSIFDVEKISKVLEILEKNLYDWQGRLIRDFSMKKVPKIRFVADRSGENISRVYELIKEIHDEEESK
jgi:ribosome-binding factor A